MNKPITDPREWENRDLQGAAIAHVESKIAEAERDVRYLRSAILPNAAADLAKAEKKLAIYSEISRRLV